MSECVRGGDGGRRGKLLSEPQQELVAEASKRGDFQTLPETVAEDHRRYLGVFAAPGIRALTYVLVDGNPWPKTSEFRDFVTFQHSDSEARVDIQPFGTPASVAWRPDGGETDASTSLDLHQYNPDGRGQYLATADDPDIPHVVIGWHNIPPSDNNSTDDDELRWRKPYKAREPHIFDGEESLCENWTTDTNGSDHGAVDPADPQYDPETVCHDCASEAGLI